MKNKMLMLGSMGAVLLSAALLITPASASASSFCTDCAKLINGTVLVVSECKVSATVSECYCPLQPPLYFNNCLPPSAAATPLK